jgi:hypothetical protein
MAGDGKRHKNYAVDGLVEGVDFKIVKGQRVPLKPNVDRTCAGPCGKFLGASFFYSSLHSMCRVCLRKSDAGSRKRHTLSGNPNRKQTKREKGELKKLREQADALARQTVVNKGVPPDVPETLKPFYEKALAKIANRQAQAALKNEVKVAAAGGCFTFRQRACRSYTRAPPPHTLRPALQRQLPRGVGTQGHRASA